MDAELEEGPEEYRSLAILIVRGTDNRDRQKPLPSKGVTIVMLGSEVIVRCETIFKMRNPGDF